MRMDNGHAFSLKSDDPIYRILGCLEAFLSYLNSAVELTKTYGQKFYRHILKTGCKFDADLKKNQITYKWERDIYNIRNDVMHMLSGWILFKKEDHFFSPVLTLPSMKNRKYLKDNLDLDTIRNMTIDFEGYRGKVIRFLIKRIKEF